MWRWTRLAPAASTRHFAVLSAEGCLIEKLTKPGPKRPGEFSAVGGGLSRPIRISFFEFLLDTEED
jgi:hypothetical protein